MSAASDALAEITQAQVTLAAPHEGLRDYAELDLKESTKAIVNAAVLDYDRRRDLQQTAIAALEALIADGYPDLPVREIPQEDFADLQANHATIEAALAKFSARTTASSLGLTGSSPIIK